MDATPHPVVLQQAQPSRAKRLKQRLRRLDRIFVFTVLVPTVLALVYYGVIATPVYVSESRFIVRSPQQTMQTGLGALLQGTGLSRSQDDTYSIHDYIRSRDALRELDKKLNLKQALSSSEVDVIDRFPGLSWDRSFEMFYLHYLKYVSVDYDTSSGVSVLLSRAYTAADARNVNEMLLEMSERLVNELNERSKQDLIQVASQEVERAESRAKTASLALSSFRSNRAVFDPGAQSAIQLQGVAKIQEELLATENQLAQVSRVSPSNPQVAALSTQADRLRSAIALETGKVIGTGSGSLAAKAPAYERLAIEQSFADKQLASAMASLEQARYEASLKQLYLEVLVKPNLPDKAMEPRRARSILATLILGLILWGVISMIFATVREHSE